MLRFLKSNLLLFTLAVLGLSCSASYPSSSPSLEAEQTVLGYVNALRHQEWEKAVGMLDPRTSDWLAQQIDSSLVEAEEVFEMYLSDDTSGLANARRISASQLHAYYPSLLSYTDLSSAQKVTAFLHFASETNRVSLTSTLNLDYDISIVGSIAEGADTAHVVARRASDLAGLFTLSHEELYKAVLIDNTWYIAGVNGHIITLISEHFGDFSIDMNWQ